MRAIAIFECVWSRYTEALGQVQSHKQPALVLVPLRRDMIDAAQDMLRLLLTAVDNIGEFGTVRNILTHELMTVFAEQASTMAGLLPANSSIPAVPTSKTFLFCTLHISTYIMLLLN